MAFNKNNQQMIYFILSKNKRKFTPSKRKNNAI